MLIISLLISIESSTLLSSKEIVANLKVGFNLGNSLESNINEENWGNPATTQEIIDGIFSKNFSSIRIPIRWDQHYSDSKAYIIKPSYLNRIKQVVDYIYYKHKSKYIIINVHHNSIEEEYKEKNKEKICTHLSKIWTQIAKFFYDYDQRLIFEVINEPRNGNDWSGDDVEHELVNYCNECARKAIRNTGGLNSNGRLIGLPPYAASAYISELKDWKLQNEGIKDKYIAVSIHGYIPSSLSDENTISSDLDDYKIHNELDYHFKLIFKIFINTHNNIPIYIGEFGSKKNIDLAKRVKHAKLYAKYARKYNISIFWWDNGSTYAIYDRNKKKYIFPEIADAMIGVYNLKNFRFNETKNLYPFLFYEGKKKIEGWDSFEFLSFKNSKGTFNSMLINPKSYFRLEYNCSDKEQFDCVNVVLQSWSGGKGWTRIKGGNIVYNEVNKRYVKIVDFKTANEFYELTDISLSLLDSVSVLATSSDCVIYSFSLEL